MKIVVIGGTGLIGSKLLGWLYIGAVLQWNRMRPEVEC